MKKRYFYLLVSFFILVFPVLIFADGGMIPWPPEVELNQSAQNAIVAWDGNEEIIILSIDLESSAAATTLRVIPLPSDPADIKEGDFTSFEKLVDFMNEKLDRGNWQYLEEGGKDVMPPGDEAGVEIVFEEEIGAHDITVAKVNDLGYFLDWIKDFTEAKGFPEKEISSQFKKGVENYLKKDIKYFVFDVIETGPQKESVEPLVYRFESDFLYYPLLISGISEIGESATEINLFLVTKKEVGFGYIPYSYYSGDWFGDYAIELTQDELGEVSEDLTGLFEKEVRVAQAYIYSTLGDLVSDLMLFPSYLWEENLTVGNRGEEVKALQQMLINDGFWESEVGATGYFGPVTKKALAKFQEQYSWDILEPVDLEEGTGYFGPQSKDYFESISLLVEPEEVTFSRNLTVGMSGKDVKALQEILIAEEVWERPDIGATGYFGPITKAAVIRYQEKYAPEILEPLGLVEGTGFVGPSTRTHLEKR